MIQKTIEIKNKLGLHARPAAQFVKTASKFKSDVFLSRNSNHEVNGKSIMGVMMLAAEMGSQLTIIVQGEDEHDALAALVELIENKFYEE
jgi:phosphocarrier protein